MEIISRFIVFLWLFPVTIFIIIPLLILLVRTIGYMFKKNTHAKAPAFSVEPAETHMSERSMIERKEQRIPLGEPIRVELSSSSGKWQGVLRNISDNGLCVERIADFISEYYEDFSVRIERSIDVFAVQCSLKWLKQQDENHECGFALAETSSEWRQYCKKYSDG